MKSLVLSILLWLSCCQVFATTYFISAKGNDQNDGRNKSTPWRSLSRVNGSQSEFAPGDSILFERGGIFEGTLLIRFSGQKGREIYVGSYGNGNLPIISGASQVENWKTHSPNIWVSDLATAPANLLIRGQRMSVGRYPNSGYRTLRSPTKSALSFNDESLPAADGYWDGAEVVVKSSRWTMDRLPVKSLVNKTFTLATPASYPIPDGFGYFIQKHIQTLDKQGEWFFDEQAHKLYLFSGSAPKNVSVSTSGPGVRAANVHDVIIEGLDIRYQNQEGLILADSESISINNVQITHAGTDGLHVTGCSKVLVENCRIADSGNNGVEWRNNSDGTFVKNKIVRSGLVAGQGQSGNGTYIALSISHSLPVAGRNVFEHNTIDSTGYLGIDFRTGFTRIINNVVSNFCMIKDDGAGIYTWGNQSGGNIIESNMVLNGWGSGEGTVNPSQQYAHGIYIDDRSSDVAIKGNTVAYCASSGIFIHNAKSLTVSGNTLFGNGTSILTREKGQLFIKRDGIVSMSNDLGLHIDNNILVSTDDITPCLLIGGTSNEEVSRLGIVEKNTFAAAKAQLAVSKLASQGGLCEAPLNLTLAEWQATGFDSGSTYAATKAKATQFANPNLVKNGTMSTAQGWMAWPDQSTAVQDRIQLLDGPSLRVAPSPGAAEVLLYHAGFALRADKHYRLSFIARTAAPAQIQFVPMMAGEPWQALSDYACFSTSGQPKEFVWYFKPDMSFNPVRVNFKSNVEFWIDNVVLQEVEPAAKVKAPVQLLLNPTAKAVEKSAAGIVDLINGPVAGMLTIPPFGSRVVIDNNTAPPTKR